MLLFFDIDGTIFDDTRCLPASVKPALEAAHRRGHRLFINTGRTLCNMDHRLDGFPLDGWIMGCGTLVIFRGETLMNLEYNPEETLRLRNLFLRMKVPVVYECNTAMYFDPQAAAHPSIRGFRTFAERRGIAREITKEDPEFRAVKMFCFAGEEKISALCEQTAGIGMPFSAIDRRPEGWELVPAGYSKGQGIDFIREKLGVPAGDCYAFGDSRNDQTMFRHAGHSIAMGNAPEDIKAMCSHVTARPEDDGIAKAMQYFGLIR